MAEEDENEIFSALNALLCIIGHNGEETVRTFDALTFRESQPFSCLVP